MSLTFTKSKDSITVKKYDMVLGQIICFREHHDAIFEFAIDEISDDETDIIMDYIDNEKLSMRLCSQIQSNFN
jgi:hypothetical protein